MRRNPLEALLGSMDDDDNDDETTILPEAQIDMLMAMHRDYQLGTSRFKVGDLVTPKKNASVKSAGLPHIILELRPDAECNMTIAGDVNPGGNDFGRRSDMRIAYVGRRGTVFVHWVQSYEFEPYAATASEKVAA